MASIDKDFDLFGSRRAITQEGGQIAEEEGMVARDDAETARQTADVVIGERKAPGISGRQGHQRVDPSKVGNRLHT
jgi:hypothetical protein